jgi:hypothetical protein
LASHDARSCSCHATCLAAPSPPDVSLKCPPAPARWQTRAGWSRMASHWLGCCCQLMSSTVSRFPRRPRPVEQYTATTHPAALSCAPWVPYTTHSTAYNVHEACTVTRSQTRHPSSATPLSLQRERRAAPHSRRYWCRRERIRHTVRALARGERGIVAVDRSALVRRGY